MIGLADVEHLDSDSRVARVLLTQVFVNERKRSGGQSSADGVSSGVAARSSESSCAARVSEGRAPVGRNLDRLQREFIASSGFLESSGQQTERALQHCPRGSPSVAEWRELNRLQLLRLKASRSNVMPGAAATELPRHQPPAGP
jgi:hypothetical protein